MKTNNFNLLAYHNGIEISISYYEGAEGICVNASHRKDERSQSVDLTYGLDGSLKTKVTDKSAPFDEEFYSALGSTVNALATAVSVNDEEEEQA